MLSFQGVYKPINDNGNGDNSDCNNKENCEVFLASFFTISSNRKMKKLERKWTLQKIVE